MALSESLEERPHTLSLGVSELLTPFFLAGIGLHLDLRALAASETLLLTALIAVVAVISKVVGCGLGAMRLGRADALRVGAGMAPRRGIGMLVAQIGLRMNVLSAGVYDAVVLLAIVTTLLGPVMLNAAFRGVFPAQDEGAGGVLHWLKELSRKEWRRHATFGGLLERISDSE